MKPEINKGGLIKLKIFCPAKEAIDKMKRKFTEQEKIFINDMTNNVLMSKIYKQFIQVNLKKNNNNKQLNKKPGRSSKQTFSKEAIEMDNKHMKRGSTL